MKQIKNFLFESSVDNKVDNIILSGSGSMHTALDVITTLQKNFKNANLYVYDTKDDKVLPLDDINEFKPSGPHADKLNGLAKFYLDHVGEMTIFVQN